MSYGLWVAHDAGVVVAISGFIEVEGRLELVVAVSDTKTRQGYGAEAAEAAISAADGLQELRASTDTPNLASRRLLERLGFVCVGEGPGRRWPQLHYALVRPQVR